MYWQINLNKNPIIIAGAGHAGIEAALAISRMGGNVLIVTLDINAVGRMSCNPAVGGLAKGHLVKEIDAFGGAMGYFADMSCLQFKTLNKSKGRAVWSPRAQVDKIIYANSISAFVKSQKNIQIKEGEVVSFDSKNGKIISATLKSKEKVKCSALIITSGTFLNGLIHIGLETFKAGRFGEKPSTGLTETLNKHGFKTGRLKTGTPPRLLADSINWELTETAKGEDNPFSFSINTPKPFNPPNYNCHIVYTDKNTHNQIEGNISKSAMFSGKISSVGPRYCPSIEDKIIRFQDKPFHQLFIEPEWINSKQIYLNGFSTSLPKETQLNALKTIPAFNNVQFIRPGYAIEYDYMVPSQLKRTLESKTIKGLFSAGQINGTSGYEEAAAQGLIAGINAHNYTTNKTPLYISRNLGYIGVLIDDLTTKDINEPYRMFTASAEHRLLLRPDTSLIRLSGLAKKHNTLTQAQTKNIDSFIKSYNFCLDYLKNDKNKKESLFNQILRNKTNYLRLSRRKGLENENIEALFSAETYIKYEGYIKRENERLEKTRQLENRKIGVEFSYAEIPNLSNEAREKLSSLKPETLGQASRIAGVKPSDIAAIAIYLAK